MSFLPCIKFWLALSVAASVAGWMLSALGHLDHAGYLVFLFLGGVFFWSVRRLFRSEGPRTSPTWKRLRNRFRHFLPGAFALLALLILLGGVLYPPSNH